MAQSETSTPQRVSRTSTSRARVGAGRERVQLDGDLLQPDAGQGWLLRQHESDVEGMSRRRRRALRDEVGEVTTRFVGTRRAAHSIVVAARHAC
jgi:hypothetical protein